MQIGRRSLEKKIRTEEESLEVKKRQKQKNVRTEGLEIVQTTEGDWNREIKAARCAKVKIERREIDEQS